MGKVLPKRIITQIARKGWTAFFRTLLQRLDKSSNQTSRTIAPEKPLFIIRLLLHMRKFRTGNLVAYCRYPVKRFGKLFAFPFVVVCEVKGMKLKNFFYGFGLLTRLLAPPNILLLFSRKNSILPKLSPIELDLQ